MENKYFDLLRKIIKHGHTEIGSKADLIALYNESLSMSEEEIINLFLQYKIPKEKLEQELELYLRGEEEVSKYPEWWYIGSKFKNSYPQYFYMLNRLLVKINDSRKQSKNYILHLGKTLADTNQAPCISLIQFQIRNICGISEIEKKLFITVYQRSADANLGLPADLYQVYLISKKINIPLANITFFYGNVHIYWNNLCATEDMFDGDLYHYTLNV